MPASQGSSRFCPCRGDAIWALGNILQGSLHAYLGLMKTELRGKVMSYEESHDASQRMTGHQYAHVGCLNRARIHDALHMLNDPPACQDRHSTWRLTRCTQHVTSACMFLEHCPSKPQAGNWQVHDSGRVPLACTFQLKEWSTSAQRSCGQGGYLLRPLAVQVMKKPRCTRGRDASHQRPLFGGWATRHACLAQDPISKQPPSCHIKHARADAKALPHDDAARHQKA